MSDRIFPDLIRCTQLLICALALSSPAWHDAQANSHLHSLLAAPACPVDLLSELLSSEAKLPEAEREQLVVTYASGRCQPGNGIETERKLRMAAKEDHPVALLVLGLSYDTGMGSQPDRKRANRYYERAARLGNMQAAHHLGLNRLRFAEGRNDRRDGVEWLVKAANDGYAVSAMLLGQIYENGRYGVAGDPCRARVWYERASRHGMPVSAARLQVPGSRENCEVRVAAPRRSLSH